MLETPKEAARRLSEPILARGLQPVALHPYNDADGNPLYFRIRAKHPDTGEKYIRPIYLNGNGYVFGEPKFPAGKKPLYALDRLASLPGDPVWVVEGEQKADALNGLGLVATTSGGATSAGGADWQPVRGRSVTIWPDNDEPGNSYAAEVAAVLRDIGCSVSTIDVSSQGLEPGDDVIDWLAKRPVGGVNYLVRSASIILAGEARSL